MNKQWFLLCASNGCLVLAGALIERGDYAGVLFSVLCVILITVNIKLK